MWQLQSELKIITECLIDCTSFRGHVASSCRILQQSIPFIFMLYLMSLNNGRFLNQEEITVTNSHSCANLTQIYQLQTLHFDTHLLEHFQQRFQFTT